MKITVIDKDRAHVIPVGVYINGQCAHKEYSIERVDNEYIGNRPTMLHVEEVMVCDYCGDQEYLEDDEYEED